VTPPLIGAISISPRVAKKALAIARLRASSGTVSAAISSSRASAMQDRR
jgi:hypothetical protein